MAHAGLDTMDHNPQVTEGGGGGGGGGGQHMWCCRSGEVVVRWVPAYMYVPTSTKKVALHRESLPTQILSPK